jgi:Mg2+ and Co2+ transporter CorA
MAYIYRHIRLDKNEPFYIGIGSDTNYKRASNKKRRSYSWKDIAYKIPYKIEIILDDISWKEACKKEIEFIRLYGRKDLNQGTLVNLTNGGEGQFGRKINEQTRVKMSKPKSNIAKQNMKLSHSKRDYSYLKNKAGSKKGIKKSLSHTLSLKQLANNKKIKIYCPELNIIFNSLTEASKQLNKSTGNISNILNSKTNKSRNGLTLIKI